VPVPLTPAEVHGVTWEAGTATCAGDGPAYLAFALRRPAYVRALRLWFTYPAAEGASCQLAVCWRQQGRNDFAAERSFRVEVPAGAPAQPVTFPVDDTVSDFRIYPDDQPHRSGAMACVLQVDRMELLVRPSDEQRLLREYGGVAAGGERGCCR
jgi:hypothetical protein